MMLVCSPPPLSSVYLSQALHQALSYQVNTVSIAPGNSLLGLVQNAQALSAPRILSFLLELEKAGHHLLYLICCDGS